MCHVVICIHIISIHYFLFKHSGFFCRVIFFELSDWSDRRLGCRNWRRGKCVSSLHCFAMLPSLFTLSFVDKEDIEYG